jgi:hypothetical protein
MPAKPISESTSVHLTGVRHPAKSSCLANLAGVESLKLTRIDRFA